MIELWGRSNAYNVQKVSWMLQELGLDYRHHEIGANPGDLDSVEFRKLNPHRRIPVLLDDGNILCESNSIVRYLAASHATGSLWPHEPLARAQAERWMDWELASLQPDFIRLFWGFYRTPVAERDARDIDAARRQCALRFDQLEAQLERQDYLAGDNFSMADIPCGTCLYRYFNMGLEVAQPPRVMQWYRRLGERAAFKKIIMRPFDELQARLEF